MKLDQQVKQVKKLEVRVRELEIALKDLLSWSAHLPIMADEYIKKAKKEILNPQP